MNTIEIKKLMLEQGISCGQMAEKMGVSAQHFSSVLNNKKAITLGLANKMQEILGIPDERFAFYFMQRGEEE